MSGLRVGLTVAPKIEIKVALECRLCRKLMNRHVTEEEVVAQIYVILGDFRYDLCPCCLQVVPKEDQDRNYKARWHRRMRYLCGPIVGCRYRR